MTEHHGIASVACLHVALLGLYQSGVIHSFMHSFVHLFIPNKGKKPTLAAHAPFPFPRLLHPDFGRLVDAGSWQLAAGMTSPSLTWPDTDTNIELGPNGHFNLQHFEPQLLKSSTSDTLHPVIYLFGVCHARALSSALLRASDPPEIKWMWRKNKENVPN
jgi:hypothetical protein